MEGYRRQGNNYSVDYQNNICPLMADNKSFAMIKSLGVIRMQT
jgi:hypothetical protein